MFKNIGKRIKYIAIVLFVINVIAAILSGIYYHDVFDEAFFGFLVFVAGVIIAYAVSCLVYGFGELIEKTTQIERNTFKEDGKSESERERIRTIENLFSKGLISEEEYKLAMPKDKSEE